MTDPVALTERQQKVLELLSQGYSYREIATELHLSIATIQAAQNAIIDKLRAINLIHAVVRAIKLGVLDIESFDI